MSGQVYIIYQELQSAVAVGGTTTTLLEVTVTVAVDVVTAVTVSGNPNSVIVKVTPLSVLTGSKATGIVVPEMTVI